MSPNYNAFTSNKLLFLTSGCPRIASSMVYLNNTVVHPGSETYRPYVTK
ncbi:predicted protein [Sclerotinia sclerotiorum 1980 UF-70]|uniref:Uncharacterized protein n=1 Tax=Sclerotinia sclerotiorum (strain ATCC 18683 / 1980 / Ss-1) TaxID=665079 RepID=A7EUX5_SCLS1|nr:predicted protein [Sclerotinia sclerotiorum 1980 UF-70]EDN93267.1 predicted protein [Sclerotinia sclerotiorum 1980 UF-70]